MKRTAFRILLFLLPVSLAAQSPSFLTQLAKDSIPDFYLTLDWKTLLKTKKEKTYHNAVLYCPAINKDSIEVGAKVRTRGHMRLAICTFPPLKIKLDQQALAQLQLADFNEFNIVHHCESAPVYDQYVLREYLAYKLWEIVSPFYFRTLLIRLHYLNEDGTAAFAPDIAFLVEDENEFSQRLGARRFKATTMHKGALDRSSFLQTCLFQFMIGNTDWYISNSHNLEFIGLPDRPLLQVVPYDFDYAGLVNAPYAAHHESISLTSTSVRYYQGWCQSVEEVRQEMQCFLDKKQAILSLPLRIPGLDERSVKYTTAYLQAFFDIIENPKKLESQIVKHCDMWPVRE